MPTGLITNPAGSDGLEATVGSHMIAAINGDTVALVPGNLVEIVTPYAGNTSPPYSSNGPPFKVKRSLAASQLGGLLLGVVSSVGLEAGSTSFPIGAVVHVVTEGPAQLIMDDANGGTTIGDAVEASTTTAGEGTDIGSSTAVIGVTIGTCLQTVTIASGNALVWVYVHRV